MIEALECKGCGSNLPESLKCDHCNKIHRIREIATQDFPDDRKEVVTGDHSEHYVNNCIIKGDYNKVYGNFNRVEGDHNDIYGTNNFCVGDYNKMRLKKKKKKSRKVRNEL